MSLKRKRVLWNKLGTALIAAALSVLPLGNEVQAATCGNLLNPILISIGAVAFGNYSAATGSANTANGFVTAACTVGIGANLPSFTVGISAGGGGSYAGQSMSFLTNNLRYNFYTDSSYSTVWGDGTASTALQSYGIGANLALKTFTIFGRIPTGQYVPAGAYLDTVLISVNY